MSNIQLIDHNTAINRKNVFENNAYIGYIENANEKVRARTYFTNKIEMFNSKDQAINFLINNKYESKNITKIELTSSQGYIENMKINAPDINELINNASKFTKKNIIERIKKMIREKYLKLNLAEIKLSKEELMNNIYRNELEKIQQKINVGGLKTRRKMRAEETGEEQFYCSYSEDCNDPKAECDIDLVNVYIKPDGSTRKERIHTY